jgi:Xaa-Pro aminopeptidase
MITQQEYVARREKVLETLGDCVGLVFAGNSNESLETTWRPHSHFEYLTGITHEPKGVLLFDPTHPVLARRVVLFLSSRDPEKEQWDGLRKSIGSDLRNETGFATVLRTGSLPLVLSDSATRCNSFATLMPNASVKQDVSQDLGLFQKISARTPNCKIIDMSSTIPILRSVKSEAEIQTIQEAVDITAAGFADAMSFVQNGVNEFQVQATLEHGYAMAGGRGSAFPPIVGGGLNSTVLHYKENDQDLVDGDLVCIDSGAFYKGYGADISRTIPVSGKFSKRQQEIYEIVLDAEEAAIDAIKEGITLAELDAIARAIIVKAGYGDYFIHSIGHHLGLQTHDCCGPALPLKEGAVITIEPGIYLPDEAMGIRIEDDIVVKKGGYENLSKANPKTVLEIENIRKA